MLVTRLIHATCLDSHANSIYPISMSQSLKISLSLGQFTLQLEGDPQTVTQQFTALQAHGLGKLAQITPDNTPSPQTSSHPSPHSISSPTLQDIVHKNTPTSEAEWILVYTHFHTQSSHNSSITRTQILEQYRTSKRYTRNRSKGLSGNIHATIKKGWLQALNDTDYVITPKGQSKLANLLK